MGFFGKKDRARDTGDDANSGYSRELAELLELNLDDDEVAIDDFMERNLVRPGFAQAVLDAGIDYWAVDDFGSALDLLQTLDLALIGHEDNVAFPDSMRAEAKNYIAWCFALTGREGLAIDVWRDAVELGSAEANYLLYLYLPEGTGLAELRAAAEAGHEKAIETLAEMGNGNVALEPRSGNSLGGGQGIGLSLGGSKLGSSLSGKDPLSAPAGSASSRGAFCEQCGATRSSGAVFCGSCGGRFPA